MEVNGEAITERESGENRSSTTLRHHSVPANSLTSAYCSLPGPSCNGTHQLSLRERSDLTIRRLRQVNVPSYVGSSSSSTTSSLSSEDAMNMRFTDITHMNLRRSLDQIHGQYNTSTDSDQSDRHAPYGMGPRQASSSSNGNYTSGSGGPTSSRDALNFRQVSGADVAEHRQQLSALVSATSGNYSQQPSKLTTPAINGSSSKFQSLLTVKDALLEEKESAIVKLRFQVSSLQHQVKDSNSTLRQVLQERQTNITRSLSSLALDGTSQNGDLIQHESEYEAAKMRVRLAENLSQQERNVNDLQSLLGKTECQLADAKSQHVNQKRILEDKVRELEFCLRTRDKTIAEAKKKQKALLDKIEKYKRRVESLERYLGDLPTMEESNETKRKAEELSTEKKTLTSEITELRAKLGSARTELREKEDCLQTEVNRKAHLEGEIGDLSQKISDFERAQHELGRSERSEFEEVKAELTRTRRAKDDAAKLLSAADARIKALTEQHRLEMDRAQERIEQEENATQTLRRELTTKQKTSAKVQSAMTQLASQNQQLLEEKLSLLEQLRALESERSTSRDAARVFARLQHETQIAARDLEAVAQVLVQSSRGDDPNLSALLGVRASSVGLADEDGDDLDTEGKLTVETATRKLADVRKLRRDIDELRSTLSNRYAENIGENCATQ